MVVRHRWRVVSGTMAAGAILVPTAGVLANDALPALEDVQPFIGASNISAEDADFYQRVADGLPVAFDFESVLTAEDTILSEPSEPTVESISVPSEPSEPTVESISVPSEPSEPSEPSVESVSVPSEPSEPSEPSF